MRTDKEIINSATMTIEDLLTEHREGILSKESILNFISVLLRECRVDSQVVVKILEQDVFGEEGKYEAMAIKVIEGW
jgi:hypothetical protein